MTCFPNKSDYKTVFSKNPGKERVCSSIVGWSVKLNGFIYPTVFTGDILLKKAIDEAKIQ